MLEWKPNSGPQYTFLEAVASGEYDEILYGGARGGGKTDAGIMSLLYDADQPLYRALVIRRNADDLRDWSDRAERWYSTQNFTKTGTPPEFVHPIGSKIRTGHLKDQNAFSKYQGHEYHKLLIEELTQIPREEDYLKLKASCRSTIEKLRPCTISNCNPDGPGFYWVKKRFRIEGTPTQPIITIDPVTGLKRIFIPSRLADNPHLAKDPTYKAFLDGLPDGLREAWRDGSWDDPIIKGAYYTKELDQARREGRIKTVPFDPALKVHTVWDLGIDDSMSIGFWQRTATDIRLINYYQNENFGLDHYFGVLEDYRKEYKYNYGKHFAPHDSSKRELSSGKTIIQIAKDMGYDFIRIPLSGIQDGILAVKLMFPRVFINEPLCEQAISAWRNYRKKWNDALLKYDDEPLHDWASHASDMLRYTAMIEKQMTNEDVVPFVPTITLPESRYEGTMSLRPDPDEISEQELAKM
jgi:hypothetical protein